MGGAAAAVILTIGAIASPPTRSYAQTGDPSLSNALMRAGTDAIQPITHHRWMYGLSQTGSSFLILPGRRPFLSTPDRLRRSHCSSPRHVQRPSLVQQRAHATAVKGSTHPRESSSSSCPQPTPLPIVTTRMGEETPLSEANALHSEFEYLAA
jgi:hypothetical protein